MHQKSCQASAASDSVTTVARPPPFTLCAHLPHTDNESVDTFSFALVLLCLAVGDIAFVRNQGNAITSIAYAKGWRPLIPEELAEKSPGLVQLIRSMWDGDFRKRPAMRDVAATLANMTGVTTASSSSIITHGISSPKLFRIDEEILEARKQHLSSPKSFALFLSHHKVACATEARLVKIQYEGILDGVECFLGKCFAAKDCVRALSVVSLCTRRLRTQTRTTCATCECSWTTSRTRTR